MTPRTHLASSLGCPEPQNIALVVNWYYEGFNIPNLNNSSERLPVRKRRLRHFLVDGQHGVIHLAADIDLGVSREMPFVKLQVLDVSESISAIASSTILMTLNILSSCISDSLIVSPPFFIFIPQQSLYQRYAEQRIALAPTEYGRAHEARHLEYRHSLPAVHAPP